MIITSFSRKGYDEYGKTFITSFLEFWPQQDLTVYHEGLPSDVPQSASVTYVDMTEVPSFIEFARKLYDADPLYHGVYTNKGQRVYNFRFDAFKFFRKVWALKHYDETRADDGLFAWLDADIEFKKPVPDKFLRTLLKEGDHLAYIGRGGGMHSECGAMIFDPTHVAHKDFFELYWRIYETGAFRMLDEYHDSFVFDFVRDLVQPPATNLGKGCDPIHPFVFTKLGLYMDHKKGPERKAQGYSPESALKPGERELTVSNNGERQARPTIEAMKANHVERYKWAAERVRAHGANSATVMDAACGVGYGSKMLAEVSTEVFAVDCSAEALAYGKDHFSADNLFFMEADLNHAEALPAADMIVSLETIEHVEDSGALVRAFKDKAPLLIGSVPNETVVPFNKKTHPYHYRHFTKDELEQLLNGAGYRVTKWATQYDKVPGLVVDDKTDGMCLLFEAQRIEERAA